MKVIATNAQSFTAVVDNGGRSDLLLQHSWVPVTLPAAVTGKLPNASGARFIGTGLDGVDRPMRAAARLAWLPQAGRNGSVSDLDLAARAGDLLAGDAALELWFAHADDGTLAEVTKALEARHISVLQVARESRTLSVLSDSPSAWSLQLGVLVGVACLLVAALGLAIVAAASWRSRTRDLAILRLNGMPATRMSRIALGEQLPTIILAVLAGAASGVLAAHFALPEVPLLPSDPQVDLIDLSAAWGTVIVLASLTLLALCGLGWLLARQTARRAALQRVLGAS